MVVPGRGEVSYKRGTPVRIIHVWILHDIPSYRGTLLIRHCPLHIQGYLAHEKLPPLYARPKALAIDLL